MEICSSPNPGKKFSTSSSLTWKKSMCMHIGMYVSGCPPNTTHTHTFITAFDFSSQESKVKSMLLAYGGKTFNVSQYQTMTLNPSQHISFDAKCAFFTFKG